MFRVFLIALAVFGSLAVCAGDQGVDADAIPRLAQLDEPAAPKEYARPEVLAGTEPLAKLIALRDPNLVVIDARSDDRFAEGHIPGARNIQSDTLQDPQSPPFYLPSAETLKNVCAQAGIDAESRVVIYDEDDGRLAARIWFTLHAFGHEHCAILNGGSEAWREEKREWSQAAPGKLAKPGSFQPSEALRGVCSFADLSQFKVRVLTLGSLPATTLLDARSIQEYMGEEVRGKMGGHIPGAANIEWSALMRGKEHARVWRSAPEIHTILRLAGVEREQKTAVYDQAGGRSAHLYFTLWLMGFANAKNYVAGWREYGNRDDVEVEK